MHVLVAQFIYKCMKSKIMILCVPELSFSPPRLIKLYEQVVYVAFLNADQGIISSNIKLVCGKYTLVPTGT